VLFNAFAVPKNQTKIHSSQLIANKQLMIFSGPGGNAGGAYNQYIYCNRAIFATISLMPYLV
jgi:hypothetical protein